jgi:hypothetical protein
LLKLVSATTDAMVVKKDRHGHFWGEWRPERLRIPMKHSCVAFYRSRLASVFIQTLAPIVLLWSTSAGALSFNKAVVVNTTEALAAVTCSGHDKIDSCIKMAGKLDVTTGTGTPSLYSIDEIAFVLDSTVVNGITPSSFSNVGVPSLSGSSGYTNASLACYVTDVDAGGAGWLGFTCEMSSLRCNALYRYQFASSFTAPPAVAAADFSKTNTTASTFWGYTTPCVPGVPVVSTTKTTAQLTLAMPKGALAQTVGFEYGPTSAYGTSVEPSSGATIAVANSGSASVVVNLSELTCETTYHYRFSTTTDDGAVNGSTTTQSADQTLTTGACKSSQTIGTVTFNPATLAFGGSTTASATASSGLAVTFESTSLAVCTVSGATVTAVNAGTCHIVAHQAGDEAYTAAPDVTGSIGVGVAGQTIGAITLTPSTIKVGAAGTASATTSSGLDVTFSSGSPDLCTVSGTTVTGVKAGSCTIIANQAGNEDYGPAIPVSAIVIVIPNVLGQSIGAITFDPASVTVGKTATVRATASSGLPVTFSSGTPDTCRVDGVVVTAMKAGRCAIIAAQSGGGGYTQAPQVTGNTVIGKGSQTLGAITFNPNFIEVGNVTSATATTTSGLDVTFATSTPFVCRVSGSTVTALASGTCTITANQAGSSDYEAAVQVDGAITVGAKNQVISPIVVSSFALTIGGGTTVAATASSGLPVTFASATPTVCRASGNMISGLSAGVCTITADQAGNATYTPATQVTTSLAVGAQSQRITSVAFQSSAITVGTSTTVNAVATSGLAVTVVSETPLTCSVDGNVVTGLKTGICSVVANQGGNNRFLAAPAVSTILAVGKASQTISGVSFTPPTIQVGGATTASATASSGLPVTFASNTPAVCRVSDSNITGLAAGNCTIVVQQVGSDDYEGVPSINTGFAVGAGAQVISAISFAPGAFIVGGTTVAAATSSSGQVVVFGSTTPDICSVVGNLVGGLKAGTCTITANQAGDANVGAAAQVTAAITVGPSAKSPSQAGSSGCHIAHTSGGNGGALSLFALIFGVAMLRTARRVRRRGRGSAGRPVATRL